jgi:glycosyltransferase involved in cell wall biosynthesis
MNKPAKIAVVIPAYNEAATIRAVTERCLQQCELVIVVDDGSTDATITQLDSLPVQLLRNETNSGKAAALWKGMQHALQQGADQIITLDGDGQHQPEDIPALRTSAAANPEHLIIAARLKDNDQAPKARLRANHIADFWISWAAGQWIHDTQSGFRLYPARLLSLLDPDTRRERGFVFESEILIDAVRKNFPCTVVPISSTYSANARASHFRPVADITRIVLMVAWRLFSRGFYPQGLWRALQQKEQRHD